jgi:hypothetical protein
MTYRQITGSQLQMPNNIINVYLTVITQ